MKPSDEELSEFVKWNNNKYNHRIEARLSCNICHAYIYLKNLNGYKPQCRPSKYYHYYNGIVLNSESNSNLIRMVELLFKLNVLPAKVSLENSLINYMLVNRTLTD